MEAGVVVFTVDGSGVSVPVQAGSRHVIVPEQRHAVAPSTDARFHVQFWVEPAGD